MKARNFVKVDEKVIAVFTRGIDFIINSDNTGSTGKWKINPNRLIDRVIIYHHDSKNDVNLLYIANHNGIESTDLEKRYKIRLKHIQYIGTTSENWKSFAECDANPVRYFF
jgi:hypothetical protein